MSQSALARELQLAHMARMRRMQKRNMGRAPSSSMSANARPRDQFGRFLKTSGAARKPKTYAHMTMAEQHVARQKRRKEKDAAVTRAYHYGRENKRVLRQNTYKNAVNYDENFPGSETHSHSSGTGRYRYEPEFLYKGYHY